MEGCLLILKRNETIGAISNSGLKQVYFQKFRYLTQKWSEKSDHFLFPPS